MTIKDRAKNRLDPEHDVDADQGIGLAFLNANPSRLRIVVAVAKQFKQNLLQETGTSVRAAPRKAIIQFTALNLKKLVVSNH